MYKAKELRDQSIEELEASYEETCKKLFELRNASRAQKQRENPHEVKHARKDIARLLTVLTEKRRSKQNTQQRGK